MKEEAKAIREEDKRIIEALKQSLEALPEKMREYWMGYAQGVSDMKREQQKGA